MRSTSSTSLRWHGLTSLLVMAASVSADMSTTKGLKLVKWNWTASDMDGIWEYSPKIASNRGSGWLNQYTEGWRGSGVGDGYPEPTQNISAPNYVWGDGTSSHTTTKADATISGVFYGTDIYFLGSTDGGLTVTVDVDGQQQTATPQDGNIAAVTGLEFGMHKVTLTFPGGSQSTWGTSTSVFNGAIVTTGLWTKAGSIETTDMKTEITAKGTQEAKDSGTVNSFYTGTEGGEWGKVFRLGGGYGTKYVTEGYGSISGYGIAGIELYNENAKAGNEKDASASAGLTFKPPPNTAYMQLEGSTHNDRSYATITIDPAPPYGEASLGVNLTQVYANPVTMAMVPLDPAVQYTVSMKVADDSIKFAFNNATFYLSTGKPGASSGGKKVAAGTIAGAVIGCLAGLALIGALVWWFMRHRRSRNVRGAGHIESFDDEGQSKRTGIMGSMRFGKGGDAKMSKAYEAKQFNIDGGSTPSLHDNAPRLEPFTSYQAPGLAPAYPGPPPSVGYSSSGVGGFDDMMSSSGPTSPPLSAVGGPTAMWAASQTSSSGYQSQPAMTKGARLPTHPEPEYQYERDGGGISVGTSAAGREIISVPPSYDQDWSSSPAAQEAAAGKSRSATGLSTMTEGSSSGHVGPSGFGGETITEEPSAMSPR